MEAELLEEVTLCRGKRVTLMQRAYRVRGRVLGGDVVKFGESVAILPVDGDEVVLLRQFRPAVGRWLLEVPAGRVEEGEDWREAARRELVEEAGYEAERIERIASITPSPGYSEEVIHIAVAEGLRYVGQRPEPTELIEVVRMKLEDAVREVLAQEVCDAKTLVSLLLYRSLKG